MEVNLLCDECNTFAAYGCRCGGCKRKLCQEHFLIHFMSHGDIPHINFDLRGFDQISDPDIRERSTKLESILDDMEDYEIKLDNTIKKAKEVYAQIVNPLNLRLSGLEANIQSMKVQCAQKRQDIKEYSQNTYIDVRELFQGYDQDHLSAIFESYVPVNALEAQLCLREMDDINPAIEAKNREIEAKNREIEAKNRKIDELNEEINQLQINHKANILRQYGSIPNQNSGNLQRYRALSEESKESTDCTFSAREEDIESSMDLEDSSNYKELICIGKKYSESEFNMFLEENKEKLIKRKRLILNNNYIRDELLNSLSRFLSGIIKLNLSNNKITSYGFDILARNQMIGLIKLDLSSNQIEYLNINNQNWPRLRHLILANNKITDEGIQNLSNVSLSDLRYLSLRENALSSRSLNTIFSCSFEQLEHLDLSQNSYSKFEVDHQLRYRFPNLKQIDLENTSVGDSLINYLSEARITTIEHLNISEDKSNPLNLDGIVDSNFINIKILNLNFCKLGLQGLNKLKEANLIRIAE